MVDWLKEQSRYVINYLGEANCDCFVAQVDPGLSHAHSPVCNTQIKARAEATGDLIARMEKAHDAYQKYAPAEAVGQVAAYIARARYRALVEAVSDLAHAYRDRPGYRKEWHISHDATD